MPSSNGLIYDLDSVARATNHIYSQSRFSNTVNFRKDSRTLVDKRYKYMAQSYQTFLLYNSTGPSIYFQILQTLPHDKLVHSKIILEYSF